MKRFLPLLITGLLILTLLPVPTHADEEALKVIVLREEKDYDIGDEMVLNIHVFYEGEYLDPDELNITLGFGGRAISSQKTETGKYSASITIQKEDVDEDGDLVILTRAYYGDYDSLSYEVIPISTYVHTLAVTIDNPLPKKGDTITVTAKVMNGTTLVDPDEIELWFDDDRRAEDELELTKASTGIYTVSYLVNPDDNESHVYEFEVEAKVGDNWLDGGVDATLRYYQVWYHNTSDFSKSNDLSFEVCVADLQGKVAPSVSVYLEYYLDVWSRSAEGELNDTTGANGRVAFTIPVTDNKLPEELEIDGWVQGPQYRQEIDSWINFENDADDDDDDEPDEDGLDVILPGGEEAYEAGKNAKIDCKAYLNGTPYQGKLTVFANNMEELVLAKTLDVQDGSFTLDVAVPPATGARFDFLTLAFQSYQDGTTYGDEEWLFVGDGLLGIDFGLDLSIGTLKPGASSKVVAKEPAAAGYQGFVLCRPYYGSETTVTAANFMDIMEEAGQGWEVIGEEGEWEGGWYLQEQQDGSFQGDMSIPGFWSSEEKFIVMVVLRDPADDEGPGSVYVDGAIIKNGESSSSDGDDDDGGFLPGFMGLEFLPALCVALLWISRKKRS